MTKDMIYVVLLSSSAFWNLFTILTATKDKRDCIIKSVIDNVAYTVCLLLIIAMWR